MILKIFEDVTIQVHITVSLSSRQKTSRLVWMQAYFVPALEMNDANVLLDLGWLKVYPAQLLSIVLIVFLTWVNTRGVKEGKLIQTTFTVTKLVSLFGLIAFGFLRGGHRSSKGVASPPEASQARWR